MIGNDSVDTGFKEIKQREPDASSFSISLVQRSVVGQGMIVEKKTCGNVECDKNIDRIMFMSSQNEENSEQIQNPRNGVHKVKTLRCVCIKKCSNLK